MDSHAEDFLCGLRVIGISVEQLKAALLTHWHNDHSAGAAYLQREFGIAVYYHSGEESFLTRQSAKKGIRGWLSGKVPEEGVLVLLRGLLEDAAPEPVTANRLVTDGENIGGGFRVIATPGHTPGHVAYVHEPTKTLFCGDALAVVKNRLRLMAKPVTPDLAAARSSALRCLREPAEFICPGHRGPLTQNTLEERRRLESYLERGGTWPLFG